MLGEAVKFASLLKNSSVSACSRVAGWEEHWKVCAINRSRRRAISMAELLNNELHNDSLKQFDEAWGRDAGTLGHHG